MSKTTLKVTCWSDGGLPKSNPQNTAAVRELFAKYPDANFEVLYRKLPRRSGPQNRYYWGVVIPLVMDGMNELGNTFDKDSTHYFLKKRFNPKEVIGVGGEVLDTIPGTTTELNTEEFSEEYIAKIKQFAAEYLSIYVPDPGQQTSFFLATYDESLKATIISK